MLLLSVHLQVQRKVLIMTEKYILLIITSLNALYIHIYVPPAYLN